MQVEKMTLKLKKLTSAIKVSHLAYAGLIAGQVVSHGAQAAPEGGVVVGGDGSISTQDLTTIIDQNSDLMAIDWDSFNLTEEELVQFLQPDSSSVVLNRILDQSPSEIRGAIEANGHVILANPRGVLFTDTATVNVGAITAAGLDMDPAAFMNGDFSLKGEDGSSGFVVNRGVINASGAVLVGKQVSNAASGLISAEMVSLAAADEAVLTFDADGMIGVKITKEVMENQLGVDSAVLNEGHIDGTQVLMEAAVSGDLFTSAVNNEGTVRARGIDTSGGTIRLTGSGGSVVNRGKLDASGSTGGQVAIEGDSVTHSGQIVVRGNNGQGGQVKVLGDEVTVSGDIDARGRAGGGEVLIGGDYQGKNNQVRNADTTEVTAEADIDASGIGDSDGGKVIVWADDSTYFAGSILAQSGVLGGDGGFVETSGKVNLHLGEDTMFVSTLSLADGETGEWLLDPGWLDISDTCTTNCISVTSLESALGSNNVTIAVTDANTADGGGLPITDDGDPSTDYADGIRVSSDLSWSAATTLTLNSFSDIRIEDGVTVLAASGDLSMNAGGSFTSGGIIDVNNFFLNVGGSGTGSANTLGSVTAAVSGSVGGGAGLDSFILTSADDVLVVNGDQSFTLAGNISFVDVDELDTGIGNDTVTAIDVATLTGNSGEAHTSGILFGGVEAISGGSLVGSDNADTFVVTGTNALTANDIAFSSISSVDAKLGNDSVTGADGLDWILTGTNYQAENSGITFSNVETLAAVNAGLIGTAADDNFVLNADGSVDTYSMAFDGLSYVDGLNGLNSLDASAYATGVALTGTGNQLNAGSITFSNIHSAVAAALAGSSGVDTFTITGTNSLDAAGINFSGVSSVDANLGNDAVVAIDLMTLTGNSGEASTSGILFSGIEAASGGSLVASDNADIFVITGANALTANDIAFSGISSIDAKLGSDSVTGADGADWTLTGTDYQAENSGITFSNVETLAAVNAGLVGTAADDSFVLNADGSVDTYSMAFDGLNSVDGLAGINSLDASAYAAGVALTGNDNQLNAGSIAFSNIQSVVAAALAGSTGADTFNITGTNSLDAYGINFSGVSSVDADLGTDTVAAIDTVALTGNSFEAITSGILFTGIETASGGRLEASDSADTFVVSGTNTLTANDIVFNGISSVDAKLGNDSVTGADGVDWTLTGTDYEASSSGITFSNVEMLTAVDAGLIGTAVDDSFVLNADGSVDTYSMTFSGLSTVDGLAGVNSLDASAYAAGVALTGSDNQLNAGSITFSNIYSAVAAALAGSSGADTFNITGTNSLDATGINFSGVSNVDADFGSDTVTANDAVNLTGNSFEASTSGILFAGIEAINGSTSLGGSDNADTFVITGTNALKANDIAFSGISSVDAKLGNDSATGADGAGWTLSGAEYEAESSGITFSNVETLTAVNAGLIGTVADDSFVLNADGSVDTYSMTFSGLNAVDGLAGINSLDASAYAAGVALTGTGNQLNTDSITFSNIQSAVAAALAGSSGADTFNITGTNSLDAAGISFSGVSTVGADLGSDTVAVIDLVTLTGNSFEAITSGILFSGIETVSGGFGLEGSDSADTFVVTGTNALIANEIAFSGISSIDAKLGNDSVSGADWTLTGSSGEASTGGILFASIEAASGGSLVASDNADHLVITGASALTAYDIAFSGISSVDAALGNDSVTGADGVDWALSGTNYEAESSGITFSNVETLAALNAGLIGTVADDSFVLNADESVATYSMVFSGLNSVDGLAGINSLDASAFATGVALTGSDNQLSAGSIAFSNIQSAVTAALTGSAGADTFNVTGTNSLDSADISFTGVDTVDADLGSDTIAATGVVGLTGNSFEAMTGGILFTGIEVASGGSLEASDNADNFVVTGANALTANDISFSGISSVDAKLGNDSVTGADGVGWTLNGTDYQAESSGITFSNVEILTATDAGLIGTAADDSFVLNADGSVGTYGMIFNSLNSVDGLAGINSLDASAYAEGVALTGSDNQLNAGSITFSNIQSAVAAALTGSTGADTFAITSNNSLNAAGISFSGVSSVDADLGDDTVSAIDAVSLTGNSLEASTSGILFAGIETVNGGTSLEGSDSADTFSITGTNTLTANDIAFIGVDSVDAKLGNDSVTGPDDAVWTLLDATSVENSGITFANAEGFSASNASLIGTSEGDNFILDSSGKVSFEGMAFSDLVLVDAAGGADFVDGNSFSDGLYLTGTDNEIESNDLNFLNVENVSVKTLYGTFNEEAFTTTGNNSLAVNNISFSNVYDVYARGIGSGNSLVYFGDIDSHGGWKYTANGIIFRHITHTSGNDSSFNIVADTGTVTVVREGTIREENGTEHDGLLSVYGSTSSDFVVGLDGTIWTVVDVNQVKASGIVFDSVENFSSEASSLFGTSGDDSFILTDSYVGVDSMSFQGLVAVDGLAGVDSVDASYYSQALALSGSNYELDAEGLVFGNIESAISAALTGTTSAEVFNITSINSMDVAGISFSEVSSVDGAGGGDTLNVISDTINLLDTSGGFSSSSINFSGIQYVDASAVSTDVTLNGTDSDDTFSVVSDGVIDSYGVSFSTIANVDGGDGSDSVEAIGPVNLTGVTGSATSSGISFSAIESVTGGSLVASDADDTFVINGSDSVTANGIAFSGIAGTIDAKLGSDSVTGAEGVDWELTGTDYEAENSGFTFSNVESLTAVNAGLIGTAADDSFFLNADGSVDTYSMTFTGLNAVDGLAGTNSLDASTYAAGVALTGTDNQLSSGSITFSNIHSAVAAALAGSTGADTFNITGINSLDAAGISFSGVNSVDAKLGSDSVVAIDIVTLTGNSGEARSSGILFSGIEAASGGSLEASDNADTFVVTGANALTANDIAFSDISGVDAKLGNDSVTGADGIDWTLTGTDYEASNSGIAFSNVEMLTAVNAGLMGTAVDDSFVLNADGSVDTYSMTFSALNAVDGLAGVNSLDASAYAAGVALTGSDNQLNAGSITFSNIQSAVAAALAGSAGADTFNITGANSLDAAGISFSGLSSVDAGLGNDAVSAIDVVALTGTSGEAVTSGILFAGIEAATGGSLAASNSDDNFVVTGINAITANDIAFSGISSVDAKSGNDSVIGADGASWTLTGNDYEAKNNGINFSNVEVLTGVNAGLIGTAADDSFVLNADGSVDIYNMTFGGLNAVDGLAGINSLYASAYTDGVALVGSDNQLSAGSIIFNNIQSAFAGALAGSTGGDTFNITGANSLDAAGISFSGLGSVDADLGSDTVVATDVVTLTGNSLEASTSGILFTGIEAVNGGAGLEGSDSADTFAVTGTSALTANDIAFSGVSTVDARLGNDSVTGADGADWTLSGSDYEATNSSIAFSGVEVLTAVNAGLIGSAGHDDFVLQANINVDAYGMTFSGLNAVDGSTGTNSLDASAYAAGVALTGADNQLGAGSITFSNIQSAVAAALVGSAGADTFTITGNNSLDTAGINFSGVNSVDADLGSDTVAAIDLVTLTGNSFEASTSGILFTGIEAATGASLEGSDNADAFMVTGANAVTANDIAFSGVGSIDAKAGDDSVTGADGADWTLTGTDYEAVNTGITFSNVETLAAVNAGLIGTSGDDTFQMLANNTLSTYGLKISAVDTLNAGSGTDTVLGRNGQGYQLNSATSVTHDGILFTDTESFSGQGAALTATSGAEGFTMTASDAVTVDSTNLSFSGLVAVDAGAGADTLAALDSVALNGSKAVKAGSISFTNIDTVTGTGVLTGTGGADQFSMVANNQLDSYGIRFEGVTSVAAAGGVDNLVGLDTEAWQLSGADNALSHAGIDFTGLESTSGGNHVLTGSASADQFTITADNQVKANSITFTDIFEVDAGGDSDLVTSIDGEAWILGLSNGSALAAGIDFTNIESVAGGNLLVDAASNNASDNFVLGASGQSLSVRGIDFASVSSVSAGTDAGDSVTSNASDWQLTGADNTLSVNGVSLTGIDQVFASSALLRGSANSETFALAGQGALSVAGMAFEGIAEVAAGAGSDLLQGTADADNFELAETGDISVAGINFSGLETVDAGEGADSVNSSGASWTSVNSGDALIDGSAVATVNSMSVLFMDLEQVGSAGAYQGLDIDSEYAFSSLDTLTVAGVTFAGLSRFSAGSGTDVLRGADIDAQWSVNTSQGTISNGGESLVFSGVESIVAGSGVDSFTLSGGEITTVDTGAGNDKVLLAGTALDSLSLGEGNDLLQIDVDSGQGVTLDGGAGNDEFQFNVAGKTWQVFGGGSRVGNFQFSGFEWLDNNTDNLTLETDQGFDFVNGGDTGANFNRNGAGILFADGIRLGYNGGGDVTIASGSTEAITGNLQADRADLTLAGNLDVTTDVSVLNVQTSGGDIDIHVVAKDDLVIDEINAGRGSITINSDGFGSLTAETYGDTHLTAGKVRLGTELQQWSVIGTAINPLRMDVSQSVDLVSISYFEPDFVGQIPAFSAKGDELQSVAGAQSAQGLKSAVQNAVEDFAQVDPGIFNAVNPYSTGVDAVNTPEMQLTGGELQPVSAPGAPGEEDELPGRAAELEDDENTPQGERKRAGVAPTEVGG